MPSAPAAWCATPGDFLTAMASRSYARQVSTLGYHKLQPWLLEKYGLHDSCGVHNLHGMPGIIGSLASVFATLIRRDPELHHWDTKGEQAKNQLFAMLVTMVIALVSGALTGLLVKQMHRKINPDGEAYFHDSNFWSDTDGSKYGGKAYVEGSPSTRNSRVTPEAEEKVHAGATVVKVHPATTVVQPM